ncbi:MAG: hypothetical protein LBR89_02230 [Holosporales bacterium]|nr:hypothetical protein [Holosporales bacterium]
MRRTVTRHLYGNATSYLGYVVPADRTNKFQSFLCPNEGVSKRTIERILWQLLRDGIVEDDTVKADYCKRYRTVYHYCIIPPILADLFCNGVELNCRRHGSRYVRVSDMYLCIAINRRGSVAHIDVTPKKDKIARDLARSREESR